MDKQTFAAWLKDSASGQDMRQLIAQANSQLRHKLVSPIVDGSAQALAIADWVRFVLEGLVYNTIVNYEKAKAGDKLMVGCQRCGNWVTANHVCPVKTDKS